MGNSIQDDLFGEDTQSPEGTATPARSGVRRYMAPVTLGGAALLVLVGVGAVAFTGLSGSSDDDPANFATESPTVTPSPTPSATPSVSPTPSPQITPLVPPSRPAEQYYVPAPPPVVPAPPVAPAPPAAPVPPAPTSTPRPVPSTAMPEPTKSQAPEPTRAPRPPQPPAPTRPAAPTADPDPTQKGTKPAPITTPGKGQTSPGR